MVIKLDVHQNYLKKTMKEKHAVPRRHSLTNNMHTGSLRIGKVLPRGKKENNILEMIRRYE